MKEAPQSKGAARHGILFNGKHARDSHGTIGERIKSFTQPARAGKDIDDRHCLSAFWHSYKLSLSTGQSRFPWFGHVVQGEFWGCLPVARALLGKTPGIPSGRRAP